MEEQKRQKDNRLCFNYGKPGHMAKDCRSKKDNKKPQQLRTTQERGAYNTTGTGRVQRLCATQEDKQPETELSEETQTQDEWAAG
jgi:hypothetical protein